MTVLNLLILLLLAAGHGELWVALINRLHSLRVPPEQLHQIRQVHDVMIPVMGYFIVHALGVTGPKLLLGGSWNDVPVWAWPLIVISTAGAIGAFWGIARYHLTKRCRLLKAASEVNHEIRRSDGSRPVDSGQYHWLARLPWNEQCSVAISRKVLEHPRLPRQWSGLRILHLSDWHFRGTIAKEYFEQVTELAIREPVDMVVFTGDLLDDERCLEWLPTTLARFSAPLGCWFILGNHDWSYSSPSRVRSQLEISGWRFADPSGTTIACRDGLLHITGDETPWLGSPAQLSKNRTDPMTPQFRLMLSHTPDHLERARALDIDLMLAGHTHGGQIMLPLIGPVYSPSRYGCRHAGGEFWQSPTLLHVSRGLSGRHPVRWRCRPEVTVVELLATASE